MRIPTSLLHKIHPPLEFSIELAVRSDTLFTLEWEGSHQNFVGCFPLRHPNLISFYHSMNF